MKREIRSGPKRFRWTRRNWSGAGGNGQVYRHGSYNGDKNATAYSPRRCLRDRPIACVYSLGGRHPLHDTARDAYEEYLWDLELDEAEYEAEWESIKQDIDNMLMDDEELFGWYTGSDDIMDNLLGEPTCAHGYNAGQVCGICG